MTRVIEAYAVIVMVPVSYGRPAQEALVTALKIRQDIVSIFKGDWRDVAKGVVIEEVTRDPQPSNSMVPG